MTTALMIVDVQKAMDHPKWGQRNNEQAEKHIADLLAFWRQNKWLVFHIKDCSKDLHSPYRSGQPLHDFKECVAPISGEIIIEKQTASAFTEPTLLTKLKTHAVYHLVIAGVHTQYCVASNVSDALAHGFKVTVVADATVAVSSDEDKKAGLGADAIHTATLMELNKKGAQIEKTAPLLQYD